ncbi:type II toxin-antitoxin system RelE/ParE family toxin [Brevundimonas halotolerans]|uniref:Plasmid stabilization system protein ParE n=1 Tax=Brevundimonas halotolerans TaxID=69670 RepID=A0A7W9E5M1_9CAUL|nr:type II toxin-antitoxin system RelE/ParE family toxin [Brevundimonas halotolerans]MBB5659497.1 plasmid stabilization system protein ParE [Brevundimonas halotolerans]
MKVRLSAQARTDLLGHIAWLDDRSPSAADRAEAAIYLAIDLLTLFPLSGSSCADSTRQFPVRFGRDGYVLRYQVMPDHLLVRRIFHSRQERD